MFKFIFSFFRSKFLLEKLTKKVLKKSVAYLQIDFYPLLIHFWFQFQIIFNPARTAPKRLDKFSWFSASDIFQYFFTFFIKFRNQNTCGVHRCCEKQFLREQTYVNARNKKNWKKFLLFCLSFHFGKERQSISLTLCIESKTLPQVYWRIWKLILFEVQRKGKTLLPACN
jgi:hypothetical protein